MISEYCAVVVMSEATDGVAPELKPGWVHRRINNYSAVPHTNTKLLIAQQPRRSNPLITDSSYQKNLRLSAATLEPHLIHPHLLSIRVYTHQRGEVP